MLPRKYASIPEPKRASDYLQSSGQLMYDFPVMMALISIIAVAVVFYIVVELMLETSPNMYSSVTACVPVAHLFINIRISLWKNCLHWRLRLKNDHARPS